MGNAQTEKDILLTKTIPGLLMKNTSEDYQTAKKVLLEMEEKHGSLPEHKFQLLRSSYRIGDIEFFKKELITLVENYGLDLIFLDKRTSYYEALTTGELSNWFKNVYPTAVIGLRHLQLHCHKLLCNASFLTGFSDFIANIIHNLDNFMRNIDYFIQILNIKLNLFFYV